VNWISIVDKDKTKKKKESEKADGSAQTQSSESVTIAVVQDKVGEGRDNLINRSKWFGSRSSKR
jgi:hypothetical protein